MRDTSPTKFLTDSDLRSGLDFVPRKGAVLLFGTACLRRVYDRLDGATHRDAVEATEQFTRFRIHPIRLLEAWTLAEQSTRDGLWIIRDPHFGCPCCEPDQELEAEGEIIHPGASELLGQLEVFAAKAALRAREFAGPGEIAAQRLLYSDIIGPPFWTPGSMGEARQSPAVHSLVAGLDTQRVLDPLGLLALGDALEEAGCQDEEMLAHCRDEGTHHRGCWVIEELSGRAARRLPLDEPSKPKRPAPLIRMRRDAIKPPAWMKPVS